LWAAGRAAPFIWPSVAAFASAPGSDAPPAARPARGAARAADCVQLLLHAGGAVPARRRASRPPIGPRLGAALMHAAATAPQSSQVQSGRARPITCEAAIGPKYRL